MNRSARITAVIFLALAASARAGDPAAAWPASMPSVAPAAGGEHPRLLFRKSDLAALREKAKTAEGQAILLRLRATLDGDKGDTFPTRFNASGHAYQGNAPASEDGANKDNNQKNSDKNVGNSQEMPLGTFTISHAAGYGLLYQLTGEQKYADLGRQAMQKSLDGVRDRDDRYSFRKPGGALRAGPSLGWTALGYDLCYDGWGAAFREKVAAAISSYDEGPHCSIESCILGKRQFPACNHWGMQVGGSAMAMLAIYGDAGADMKKFKPLFDKSQQIMIRNMTEGFGDGGFFPEGDGTGSMSSHIVFLTALQSWKTAFGKDFITPRPNAQWMANRWMFLTLSRDGKPDFWPQRGAYPHNIWARDGLSGGGYFSIGMGIADSHTRAAMLWCYNHGGFSALDEKNKTPFDTPSPYPHHAVLSFVNWPAGEKEKDPDDVFPHAFRDSKSGFYAWRNRWQDSKDVIISILTRSTKGNYSVKAESALSINNGGKHLTWGNFRGFTPDLAPAKDGSTILATRDGGTLVIDLSAKSGMDVMLVSIAPNAVAKSDATLAFAGQTASLLFLGGGKTPTPRVEGDRLIAGRQTLRMIDGKINFEPPGE